MATGYADAVTFVECASDRAGREYAGRPVGLLFVDAGHDYESVMADVLAWWGHIARKGYLAFHDIQRHGVWKAQQELIRCYPDSVDEQGVIGHLGVFRKVR